MIAPGDLISVKYRALQRELHAAPRGYGQRGHKWAPVVVELVQSYGATSVLDYGCGTGSLVQALRSSLPSVVRLAEYDPAIPGKDLYPSFADLVVCTDVLEHVEPDRLRFVLTHLQQLARKAIWVVVSLVETAKILSDGRNAHLIIQPTEWWVEQFRSIGCTVLAPPDSARRKPEKEWIAVVQP